jgi:ABC-type phosphate transport system substrate-binding protein
MRTTIAMATFLAVGAGAAGVSALDIKGSDTLKELTRDILGNDTPFGQDCGGTGNSPAGTLNYVGTGSGNGQAALVGASATQQIAPMSRGFNNGGGICGTADLTKAEGVVHSLDGLALVANAANFGTAACNGTVSASCVADTTKGLLNLAGTVITPDAARTCPGGTDAECNVGGVKGETCNTTTHVCQYTVASWRDALRILYAGMSVPGDATLANRNCASPERKFLAANWNNIFQANTCATGLCPAGIKHAFRRNDESGTSDVFQSLLQLPTISLTTGTAPFCNTVTNGLGTMNTATGVFTNAPNADANSGPMPTPPAGFFPTPVPTNVGGVVANRYPGPNYTDFQDGDVIRRACDGAGLQANTIGEDVCAARGDLGLVLPIWDTPTVGATETAYPTAQCDTGNFAVLSQELKVHTCSNFPSCFDACPNGVREGVDTNGLFTAGSCAYPVIQQASGVLDPRCYNTRANNLGAERPAATASNVDGRVYNLHIWTQSGTSFIHAKATRASGQAAPVPTTLQVAMVGAYYRIHSKHSNNQNQGGSPVFCKGTSATDNIGCLVQASPCSIGYAGREAAGIVVNGVQGAVALKVNGVDPEVQCVRNLIASTFFPAVGSTYPISRRLFVNTIKGFDNVTGDENKLALCYQNRGIIDPLVTARGFITLSPTAAGRPAYCADFDEKATCNTMAANTDACKNHVAGSPFPKCEEAEDPTTCH